ncbi:hypothetical protein Esti_003697 [Eimeria stiedai]
MPAAGGSGGAPAASSRGRGTSGSKGPPEGSIGWATASSRSTTEEGAQNSSPARSSTHLASRVGMPRSAGEGTRSAGLGGPREALVGAPMGHQPDLNAASSTQPRVLGGSQGRLSMRGPRGSSQGAPLHATADPDHGEYVNLTDSEYGSGAEDTEAEGGYRGSGLRAPPWGRRRGPPSGLQRILSGVSAYSRLAVRRLTLGCRFLLFWAKDNERQLKVLLYTATLLVSSTGNTIAFKRMLDKMPNYSGFLNQLTNFVFIPVFAAFCIYQYSQGKLSQEVLRFPKKNFALMGCLDGVCGIMSVVGGVHTSGTAQVVLSQLGIPVMLLLCRFVLGKTYNAIQHLGAAVIIVGVLVVESPGLLHPSVEDSSNLPFFNLLFLLSILVGTIRNRTLGLGFAFRRENEEEDGGEEGTLERDITATAEAAHVHIKVLASDPSIRNDGYFQVRRLRCEYTSRLHACAADCHGAYTSLPLRADGGATGGPFEGAAENALVTALAAAAAVFWVHLILHWLPTDKGHCCHRGPSGGGPPKWTAHRSWCAEAARVCSCGNSVSVP